MKTYLHMQLPCIKCDTCQVTKNVPVPWARPGSGFTLLFEAFVMELAQAMATSTAGKIVSEHDTRLMRKEHNGQLIKRRARGYQNTNNFITMIYLACSKLDFNLPQVCGVTHGK